MVINTFLRTPIAKDSYKLQIIFYNSDLGFFIRCYLVRGEFDDLLKWPLKAMMKIELLNQQPRGRNFNNINGTIRYKVKQI